MWIVNEGPPQKAATWQSPGTRSVAAVLFGGWYQGIATGLKALAMTADIHQNLHLPKWDNIVYNEEKPTMW